MSSHKSRRLLAIYIILSVIGFFFVLAGVAFKVMHWPGSLLISLMALPFFITALILYSQWKKMKIAEGEEVKPQPGILSIIAPGLVILGLIFQLLRWPGANYLLIGGAVVGCVAFIMGSVKKSK